jgi:hypothetical protein
MKQREHMPLTIPRLLKKPSTTRAAGFDISAAQAANKNQGRQIETGTGLIDSMASFNVQILRESGAA